MVLRFLPDIFKSYIKCGQILLRPSCAAWGLFLFLQLSQLIVNAGGVAAVIDCLESCKGNIRLPGIMMLGYVAAHSENLAMAVIISKVGACFISPRHCGRMAWDSRRLTPNRKRNWTQWKKCLNVFSCFTANVCVCWFVFQGDLWQKVWVTGNVQISISTINFFEHHCNLSLYSTLCIIYISWRIHCAHMQKHTIEKNIMKWFAYLSLPCTSLRPVCSSRSWHLDKEMVLAISLSGVVI